MIIWFRLICGFCFGVVGGVIGIYKCKLEGLLGVGDLVGDMNWVVFWMFKLWLLKFWFCECDVGLFFLVWMSLVKMMDEFIVNLGILKYGDFLLFLGNKYIMMVLVLF